MVDWGWLLDSILFAWLPIEPEDLCHTTAKLARSHGLLTNQWNLLLGQLARSLFLHYK